MTSNNSNIVKIKTEDDDVTPVSCSRPEIKTDKSDRDNKERIKNEDGSDYTDDCSNQTNINVSLREENNEDENNCINDIQIVSCDRSEMKTEKNTPIKEAKKTDEDNPLYDLSVNNMPENYRGIYEDFVNEVRALSTIPILKSISEETIRNFEPYNRRYYDDKYCIDFGVTETRYCDINVRIHTNKLFLIALASGNDIIRNQKDILEINFKVNNIDRSEIQLKGKKKRGSKSVEPHTILCQVKYQGDDKMYNIRAGVRGRIIEINELIKKNPNLIRTAPKGPGYIAVISPQGNPRDYEKRVNNFNLLSEEEYFQHLLERVPRCTTNS